VITLADIEKIMPSLKHSWINPGPDGRMRWGGRDKRDTWQSVFLERETQMSLLEIINGLEKSNMTVLDLGCEAGLWSVILSQKFKKVIAIDSDKTSITNAKKTLEIFDSFGFDVSNIELIHCRFLADGGKFKTLEPNKKEILLEYDAMFLVDSTGTNDNLKFFEEFNDILPKVKMIIRTDRENFQTSIEQQEEYIEKARKKYQENNFNLTELKTMKFCRRADVFIGRNDNI